MRTKKGLWSRSAPWRWTLVLTCLMTLLVIIFGPWSQTSSRPVLQKLATYHGHGHSQAGIPTQALMPPTTAPPDPSGSAAIHALTHFPVDTQLHVVGVYQGALPNGQHKIPWWATCGVDIRDNPSAAIECHKRMSHKNTETAITITVASSSVPMVLVFMAYEPVKWKIIGAHEANIQKIILAGYHGQDIEGILQTTPVEAHSYDPSPCQTCSRQADYFFAYDQYSARYTSAINKIQSITGLQPASFQGAYQSDEFYISSINSK